MNRVCFVFRVKYFRFLRPRRDLTFNKKEIVSVKETRPIGNSFDIRLPENCCYSTDTQFSLIGLFNQFQALIAIQFNCNCSSCVSIVFIQCTAQTAIQLIHSSHCYFNQISAETAVQLIYNSICYQPIHSSHSYLAT